MNINDIIIKNDLDGVFVTSLINIRYLSSFTGSDATVLITKDKKYIFVDSRYYEQATAQCIGFNVILITNVDLLFKLNDTIEENNIKNLGFEQDNMLYESYAYFKQQLKADLKPISLKKVRMVKNQEEIDTIKKAIEITDDAYDYILEFIKIGMSEMQIANELNKFILDQGATGMSFETIVASGKRGSMPHGVASDKLIEENDFVTIDFGVFYNGYCSDMTRSFVVGTNPDKELVKIYNVVKEAQQLACDNIKPGMKASEVDAIARNYIKEQGYGEYFNHGLGHSIGLEIHELPYVSPTSHEILETNQIITIEPGIYIPELGGIRIEDDVLITKDGAIQLNRSSKELIYIDGRTK
ncbi:MAG: aminopeptidase P family protein [Erysipelotrichales bacterium]